MARVVCQVLVRPDRLSFLWSAGSASFEPYHKTGSNLQEFRTLTRRIDDHLRGLADRAAGGTPDDLGTLARDGHELYHALFRADDAQADAAPEVRTWLADLERHGDLESLEIVSDAADALPWNAVHDSPADEHSLRAAAGTPEGWHGFWGARLELVTGRRISPLRARAVIEKPAALLAIDPALRADLSGDEQERLRAAAQAGAVTVVENAGGLNDAIRAGRPDVLYLLCRVSGHSLLLGGEAVSAGELRDLLRSESATADGRSDTFVILNSCRSAGAEAGADVFDLLGALGTRAFLAPRVPVPAAFANRFGAELLTGLLARGEPLGRLLRHLRGREAPLGLLYTACAPAGLRFVQEGTADGAMTSEPAASARIAAPALADAAGSDMAEGTSPLPLPEMPYFPLLPYDSADRALFLGREDDTEAFTEALDEPGVRLLVLHGACAVGKGSLLRAGVVPLLEEGSVGYRALRDRTEAEEGAEDKPEAEDDFPIAMVRATGDLAGQLAVALCDYCARPYTFRTPTGRIVTVDLPQILSTAIGGRSAVAETAIKASEAAITGAVPAPSAPPPLPGAAVDAEALRTALRQDLRLLGRLLAELAERLPHELVLFIEQGEEMFTLVPGGSAGPTRVRGLAMLRQLAATPGRARVILALRTEYHGRLLSQLQQGPGDLRWLRSYHLEPLDEKALLDAVLAPTSIEPLADSAEAPFTKYRFLFEDGLAEQVVRAARRAASDRRQSAVALLQVVCARLAAQVQGRPDNVIRASDLKRVGGVEDGLVRDFEARLRSVPLAGRNRALFRQVLDQLVTHTAEGTPVRALIAEEKLVSEWKGTAPLPPALDAAAAARLLELSWLDIGGQQGRYVSLGHDVLAPVAEREAEETGRRVYGRARIGDTLWIMVPLVILAVVWGWTRMRVASAVQTELDRVEVRTKDIVKTANVFIREAEESRGPLYAGFLSRAREALAAGDLLRARQYLLSQMPTTRDPEQRGVEDWRGFDWHYLWRQLDGARHTLLSHLGPVLAVAAAADGKTLATGSADGTVKLWDTATGQIRATLRGHKGAVHALAFAPKEPLLASSGADGTVLLWDANTGAKGDYVADGKALETLKGDKAVNALVFTPDGKTLATGGAGGAIKLWDVTTRGKAKAAGALTEHKGAVHALAYAPDGKTLASGGQDRLVRLWDVTAAGKEKVRETLKGHDGPVHALAYAPDGKLLASGDTGPRDGIDADSVRVWDAGSGKELRTLDAAPNGVFGLAFADNKTLAVAGKDDAARLWDADAGRPLRVLRGHLGWVRAVAWTSDGKTLVSGSQDGTARVWDRAAAEDVLRGHKGGVNAVAFAPDDRKLASGGTDGTVKLWDVAAGKEEKSLAAHQGAVLAVAYSPDGKMLASAGADGLVKLWDVDTKAAKFGAELGILKGHEGAVNALAFVMTGKNLATAGDDGTVRVWVVDPADKANFAKKADVLKGHKGGVRALAVIPASPPILASAGDDRVILLWDLLRAARFGKPMEGHTAAVRALAYWNGTKVLTSGSADRTVQMWDVEKALSLATLRGHAGTVTSLAFASNPPLLASGGADGVIELWNPALAASRFTLVGHEGPVQAVAVASDQRTLASAGRDGTVRLWRGAPRPVRAPEQEGK